MTLIQKILILGCFLITNTIYSQQNQNFIILDERGLETAFIENIHLKRDSYFQLFYLVTIDCSSVSKNDFSILSEKIKALESTNIILSDIDKGVISFTMKMTEITIDEKEIAKKVSISSEKQIPYIKINLQNIQLK